MSEAPRGKRFQLHLSTAVVMMIAAGILIWANVTPRRTESIFGLASFNTAPGKYSAPVVISEADFLRIAHDNGYDSWLGDRIKTWGWPYELGRSSIEVIVEPSGAQKYGVREIGWHVDAITVNPLVALSILFAIWFVCEWWIRRRAARKGT